MAADSRLVLLPSLLIRNLHPMPLAHLQLARTTRRAALPVVRFRRGVPRFMVAVLLAGVLPCFGTDDRAMAEDSGGGRPAFAALEASVANWNGDVRPDGWVARVQVFDDLGRPVSFAGSASFELVPRVPSADYTRFVAVRGKRLRWSTTLTTDRTGGATVRLPLRRSLPHTSDGHVPFSGVMRVRLAVPTAGVYDAESVVAINPPGLVDTLWKPR